MAEFGHLPVVLSSSNTFSYDKLEEPLSHYIHHRMGPQTLDAQAHTTFYKFGNNHPVIDREVLHCSPTASSCSHRNRAPLSLL